MKLAKLWLPSGAEGVGIVEGETIRPLTMTGGQYRTLTDILESDDPMATAEFLIDPEAAVLNVVETRLLPPVDRQEVWAAGVTYMRSRAARMDESAGAASFYDMVYEAPRPELFFKATAARVVGHGHAVRIRQDTQWTVPEPELALVLNSRLKLVGYTIGNDMSARDIEGENPLYLPQAKMYDESCALGPWITLPLEMPSRPEIGIRMAIIRDDAIVFEGETSAGRLARSFATLVEYLGRDNTFRDGCVLLTGTGIVPEDQFSLQAGDIIDIAIDGIGTLSNHVVQG